MGAATGRKVSPLRGDGVNLAAAAEQFLSTNRIGNPNTHRAYASAIDRTVAVLGASRLLAEVADDEIGAALTQLWDECAPATWNHNRAAVSAWLTWCATKKRWVAPSVPGDVERRPPVRSAVQARLAIAVISGWTRRAASGPNAAKNST